MLRTSWISLLPRSSIFLWPSYSLETGSLALSKHVPCRHRTVASDPAQALFPPPQHFDLPQFSNLSAALLDSTISSFLDSLRKRLRELEETEVDAEHDLSYFIHGLEDINNMVEKFFSPFSHLEGVKFSQERHEAYTFALTKVVAFDVELGQSERLYQKFTAFSKLENLPVAERRSIDGFLLKAKLSGVDLQGAAKAEFLILSEEKAVLTNKNLLDATKSWNFVVDVENESEFSPLIEDFPITLKRSARAAYVHSLPAGKTARGSVEKGPWMITLDFHIVGPFLESCSIRSLREKVYSAFISRATNAPHDNSGVLARILEIRHRQAALLGYSNYGEVSFAEKMARNEAEVRQLLDRVREVSWNAGKKDLEVKSPLPLHTFADDKELTDFAKEYENTKNPASSTSTFSLRQWDTAYYSRLLKEKKFSYEAEKLREFLPFEGVVKGLFDLANRLFGIRVIKYPTNTESPILDMFRYDESEKIDFWARNVDFYCVYDENNLNVPIAAFYLDPFARPGEKNGGAWMDVCNSPRYRNGQREKIPVAYLVCNFSPPTDSSPSLLTFREVETLFHEFGHGLQHMLTKVNNSLVAGLKGIEWDAVELPSQFMENWCYHADTFLSFAKHYETGERLDDEIFKKIQDAKTYMAGLGYLRQLQFGYVDLLLHTKTDPAPSSYEEAVQIQRSVMEITSLLTPLPNDGTLCSFAHIFAGGYACGYYSYLWAKVLSADAFEQFVIAGLSDPEKVKAVGMRFRDTVLSLGGSQTPMDVFLKFKGAPLDYDSLLRQEGLLEE